MKDINRERFKRYFIDVFFNFLFNYILFISKEIRLFYD